MNTNSQKPKPIGGSAIIGTLLSGSISIFIIGFLLSGCTTQSDILNDKLANKTVDEHLVVLRQECSDAVKYYGATRLSDDPKFQFLLPKICAEMESKIMLLKSDPEDKDLPVTFNKLFDDCIAESKNSKIGYHGRHSNGGYYQAKAQAICKAYQKEFWEIQNGNALATQSPSDQK